MTLGREGEKFIRYNAQAKAGQQQVKQRLQKLKKYLELGAYSCLALLPSTAAAGTRPGKCRLINLQVGVSTPSSLSIRYT